MFILYKKCILIITLYIRQSKTTSFSWYDLKKNIYSKTVLSILDILLILNRKNLALTNHQFFFCSSYKYTIKKIFLKDGADK